MNKPSQPNLTKTCVNCGQQKPLTAFLEMSGTQGTAYGNVCSACRKTALEAQERRKKTEAEGSTTTETGHKIDSKTKVHDAIGKRERSQQIEEDYHKERDLDEKITEKVIEKKQAAEHKEKKHRTDFLDKRPVKPAEKTPNAGPTHAAEITARTTKTNEAVAIEKHGAQEERKKTEHDFSIPYQGQQMGGQIRFSGPIFQQFRQWLGNSAPIVNNVNVTLKETSPKQSGAITQSAHQIQDTVTAADKGEVKKDNVKTDPVIDFIEENFRPGSKR